MEALAALARMLKVHPVLVMLIARTGDLIQLGVAAQVLAELDQQEALSRIAVAPLSPGDVGRLARAVVGAPDIPEVLEAWLIDRSRGNPLFAVGLLEAVLDSGGDLDRPHLERVPLELADRVLGQLRGLDEPALATLEVLALLGRVEITDLARLAGRPFDRLAEILDGLVRRRLLTEQEVGRQIVYEVAHPLVQETVYESIGPARRRALHRQVARGLKAMGKLGAAAPHFDRSAGVDDGEAIDALVDAVREAEGREAYQEAFVILKALLALLPAGDRKWLRVLQSMAREPEWVIDHRVDLNAAIGIDVLRRIGHALAATPDARGRAEVQFRLDHFLAWGLGELAESASAIAEAQALFARAGTGGPLSSPPMRRRSSPG